MTADDLDDARDVARQLDSAMRYGVDVARHSGGGVWEQFFSALQQMSLVAKFPGYHDNISRMHNLLHRCKSVESTVLGIQMLHAEVVAVAQVAKKLHAGEYGMPLEVTKLIAMPR